jgi:predicted porin
MKKSLIALAVMAAAGAASAQSSVTLFGIVDAAITHGSASNGGQSFTGMTSSGYNSSRLGFRGTEDLGGGMSASFWLEGSLSNDDGTPAGLMFQRRSTVSLAGGWGELRLGRDYTPTFWNLTIFDPFGTNGVGTTLTSAGPGTGLASPAATGTFAPAGTRNVLVRASNDVGYFLPANLGGIYGQVNYWFGENNQNGAVTEDDGRGYGLRVGYGAGPFNVAIAYAKTDYGVTAPGVGGDYTTWNIGGQWDFGMAKVMAQFAKDQKDSTTEIDGRGWLIGALVPVGAGEIRASYSTYKIDFGAGADPRTAQFALGYVHNLSKRTAVYATVAHARNKNGASYALNGATVAAGSVNFRTTGYDLGIRHSF